MKPSQVSIKSPAHVQLQTTVHDATMLLTHLLQKPWVTARRMTQHSLDKKGKEFVLSGLQMGTKTSNVHLSLCLATDHMCFAGIIVEQCMCWGSVSMETEHKSVRQRKLDGLHARLLEAPDFNYLQRKDLEPEFRPVHDGKSPTNEIIYFFSKWLLNKQVSK